MTIEGVKKEAGSQQNNHQKVLALLRIVEGISRSLNNLLERFHQSFFFYVIVSSDRFVSIGDYMPSIGLMAGSLLIKSFLLWLIANTKEESDEESESNAEINVVAKKDKTKNIDVLTVGIVVLGSHLIGIAALFITTNKTIHNYLNSMMIQTQTGIFYLILIIFIVSLVSPKVFKLNNVNGQFLNIVVLLELGTMLLAVSMLNFSLGFFLCVVTVPFAIFMNCKQNGDKRNL